MKKVLLGSAAAIAFGAVGFAAAPASAQLELTITGSVEPEFAFFDRDRDTVSGYTADPGGGTAVPAVLTVATSTGLVPFSAGFFAPNAAVVAGVAPALLSSSRAYASTTRFILRFNADGTADNGLRYGVRVRMDDNDPVGTTGQVYGQDSLRTRGAMYVRELWGYVRGEWGEVRGGEAPIAFDLLSIGVPTGSMPSGAQGVFNNWDRYIPQAPGGLPFRTVEILAPTSILTRGGSSHPSGVSYVLNNFHGFSFGLTYAPTTQGVERAADVNEVNAGFSDIVSVAANYQGEFSGVRFGISAGGNFANAEDTIVACTVNTCQRHDLAEWRVGAQVGYGGFTLGGFYRNAGRGGVLESNIATGRTDQLETWGVGGHYTTGPWQFAINYVEASGDPFGLSATATGGAIAGLGVLPGVGSRDYAEQWGVGGGVSYSLAPGLTPYASIAYIAQRSILTSNPAINGVTDFSDDTTIGMVGVNFTF